MTRRFAISPIPITIQFSMGRRIVKPAEKFLVVQYEKSSCHSEPAFFAGEESAVGRKIGSARDNHFQTDSAEKPKAGLSRPSNINITQTLRLLGSDRVLGSLGDAELYHGLRLDLDRFARLRVASNAGLAVRFHQPAEAGHNEHAVLLGFFHSDVGQVLKKSCDSLVGKFSFLGQMADELSLG